MDVSAIYAKIRKQLDAELPFVMYRKANKDLLNVFIQENDTVYTSNNYTASGFVFAPFDQNRKAVLIPTSSSKYYSSIISKIDSKEDINRTLLTAISEIKTEEKEGYMKTVANAIKTIATKKIRKVVLSRKEKIKTTRPVDSLILFQRLITTYANAFVYLWYHPKVGMWLGATPETLLSSDGKEFFTMALAGTQLYDPGMDASWGSKEIEEQEMVTEFIVKELSSISGNVSSSEAYTDQAGTLLHLRTDITGKMDFDSTGLKKVLTALHPTPAVCGLPKQEAKRFILNNEGYNRKFYTGFLGELNLTTDQKITSDLFVNLRCMEIESTSINIYVGGGITKGSDPEKEWEETVRKTETMKKVLF